MEESMKKKFLPLEEGEVFNPRILLVEDNDMNRKIVIKVLKTNGLECELAANGHEAVGMVQEKDYDLIFMDCQMPIMDGYECTRKIRQFEGGKKHTVIIAMTANAMEGDREKCLMAGMDDYLSKPIDFEKMFTMMRHYVSDRSTTQEGLRMIKAGMEEFVAKTGFSRNEAKEFYDEYLEELPELLHKMGDCLERGDLEQARMQAHSLKGSSGNLRIQTVYEMALELEKTIKQGDAAASRALVEDLTKLFHF